MNIIFHTHIDEYVKNHGFWFASNAEQEAAAKLHSNLIPLTDVFERLSLPAEMAIGFYVPTYFSQINSKEELPVWVWRKCRFDYRPMQIGDYAHWNVSSEMNILVKIADIKGDKVEISVIGSNDCKWVPINQVRKINC